MFQHSTMQDLTSALTITVLSSTFGLAVAAVVPFDLWRDPRTLAPVVTLLVNAVWLGYRIWKRRQYRQAKQDAQRLALAVRDEQIAKLERENERLRLQMKPK